MTETKKIKINLDKESYDIHIGANLSDEIPNIVSKLTSKNKVFLICDESLGSLILPQVKNSLSKAGFEIFVFALPEHHTSFIQMVRGEQDRLFTPAVNSETVFLQIKQIFEDLCIGEN